jgi:antitoxin (DNA-binding transcriptional repressor) of toxin-antitoxin stability system
MKVSMADVNKKANAIINQVAQSGEVATIYKHGKPIAEIHPVSTGNARRDAIAYLTGIKPIKVGKRIDAVMEAGRKRGV